MTRRSLWRDRNFTTFWLADILSVAGDSFSYVALPLLVLAATGSVAQMGLLTAISGGAALVTGALAGVVVDRVDRRALMIGCNAVHAVVFAAIPLAWLAGPQLWVLYVMAPLGAAVGRVFQVAHVTAVPSLVGADRITEANGRLFGASSAAAIVGPLLAGLVSSAWGPETAVAIDAGTFALAAVGLCFVRLRAASQRTQGGLSWREFVAGAEFLWRHRAMRSLTILLSVQLFLTFGLTDLFIYHLKHDLQRTDATVGTVVTAGAVGTLLGAVVVARARRRLGFGTCFVGSVGLGGLAVAALGLRLPLPAVTAAVATFSFFTCVAAICSLSLRQEVTPDHLLGRVTSAFWTIHYAPAPIGAALLTVAAARYGTPPVFVLVGLGSLAVAAAAVLTPIRQRSPEALPAPQTVTGSEGS